MQQQEKRERERDRRVDGDEMLDDALVTGLTVVIVTRALNSRALIKLYFGSSAAWN